MTKAFENVKEGLMESIAHAKGDPGAAGVRVYRQQVGMTQDSTGPALTLVNVIDKETVAVLRALAT